jgi:hypothetical protein
VATLRELSSGALHRLGARSIVGRAGACDLRIVKSEVSSVHAEILWDGTSWQVQDLGSRNGTFVDGRRLAAGEHAMLCEGATLTFGVAEHRYALASASPPCLMASPDCGEPVIGERDILCLPTVESSELAIFCDSEGHWVVESEAGRRVIEDQALVSAGGRIWRVHLPAPGAQTRGARREQGAQADQVALEFAVSRDGEHITLSVARAGITSQLDVHR